MAQLLSRLADRHDVALFCLRAAGEPPIDENLQARLLRAEEIVRPQPYAKTEKVPFLSGEQRSRAGIWAGLLRGHPAWVTQWSVPEYRARLRGFAYAWMPDVVQFEFHVMGQYVDALSGLPACRVLTQHEPGTQTAVERMARGGSPGRWMPRLNAAAWARYERNILRRMDAIVTFTERDRQATAELVSNVTVVTIPLGAEVPTEPLDPIGSTPEHLLFFGNFVHTPNIHAAFRLAKGIFPRLRARYPGVTLDIVGPNPPPDLLAVQGNGIRVTGYVPDLTPYLNRAAIIVNPLSIGSGMRVKVLESLAAGKAIVATIRAVEGLTVSDGEQVLLAESDEEFVDAITHLLDHPPARLALAQRARLWATQNLDWDRSVAQYESLYTSLLSGRTPGGDR